MADFTQRSQHMLRDKDNELKLIDKRDVNDRNVSYHASTFITTGPKSISNAILQKSLWFNFHRRVLGLVEVGKQEQEHDTVQTDPHHETLRVVAVAEQQLELMRKDSDELNLKEK